MTFFQNATSKGPLNVYRLLSKSGAVRVSPLCLGAMNLGDVWQGFMGTMDKKQAFAMLDYFFEQGGNFIDTANNYQDGQSEEWLGDWMQERKNRDQIVLATKFSSPYMNKDDIRVNYAGNARKSLHMSVRDSLKKLKTDYIDLLYIHWWDYTTSVEELMPALDALVKSGKVLYLGASDLPAWVVAKCNTWARDHGMSQFVCYQGRWSVAERDFERDILPMCIDEGMGLLIYGALGSGKFKTPEQIKAMEESGDKGRTITGTGRFGQSENDKKAVVVLDAIAKELSTTITSVAMAWVMHKAPYVFPIVGGRKVEHLKENIDALHIVLTPEHMKQLDAAVPLHLGFPYGSLGTSAATNFLINLAGVYQWVEPQKPIAPSPKPKAN